MKIKFLFSSILGGVAIYLVISLLTIISAFVSIGSMLNQISMKKSDEKIVKEFGEYLKKEKEQVLLTKTKKTIFSGPLQTISEELNVQEPPVNPMGTLIAEYIQAKENEAQILSVKACMKASDDKKDDLVALIITNVPRSVYSAKDIEVSQRLMVEIRSQKNAYLEKIQETMEDMSDSSDSCKQARQTLNEVLASLKVL